MISSGNGMTRDGICCLIFDLDGTLYRQAPVRRGMLLRLLLHCGRHPKDGLRTISFIRHFQRAQEELRHSGASADQLKLACRRARVATSWGLNCIEHWFNERPLDLIAQSIYPELPKFLERARTAGFTLAVVSDYPAERKLRALGILDFFSSVVSSSDSRVGCFKPSPNGIRIALEELRVPASRALYIGDRPEVDAEAAKRADMSCVIIGSHPRDPHASWRGERDYRSLAQWLGVSLEGFSPLAQRTNIKVG